MPPTVLRYGFKIFLDHEAQPGAAANGGFIVSTDNLLLPAGVRSNKAAGTLRFEHGVFQLVSGDGDVTLDITQKRLGEEIKFGQVVRLLHVTSNSFPLREPATPCNEGEGQPEGAPRRLQFRGAARLPLACRATL
jgi:hypothetical protein